VLFPLGSISGHRAVRCCLALVAGSSRRRGGRGCCVRRFDLALESAEEVELVGGTEREDVLPNGELELALLGGGQLLAEGVKLGKEEVVGDAG
jgi:hypothetical protein